MYEKFAQILVKKILASWMDYEWSIQGFGMLRLYLPDDYRLNIWHAKFRVPNVSLIHTHPWDFESLIVCGTLQNQRYFCMPGDTHKYAEIKPGPNGGLLSNSIDCRLVTQQNEIYNPGEIYHQKASEIHLSNPCNGCITINKRVRVGEDKALVFWESNTRWVSAEPRKATKDEAIEFVASALSLML